MNSKSTWIGKGIAVGLAALAVGIALPSESDHMALSLPTRVLTAALFLSFTFGLYELLGRVFGRVAALFLPDASVPSQFADEEITRQPSLRATTALLILAAYAAGQIIAYVITVLIFKATGVQVSLISSDPVPARLLATASLAAVVVGGAAAIGLTAYLARGTVRTPEALEIGLVSASYKTALKAALPAAALALLLAYVGPHLVPVRSKAHLGPLVQLAQAGGWPRLAWAVIAVILAPPIEEFVFRGVLLAGLARSWNLVAAGTVVSVLFVAFHLPYAARYWPAVFSIALMAVYVLALRLRTGSLLPPVAAHVAYNSVVVLTVYAAQSA